MTKLTMINISENQKREGEGPESREKMNSPCDSYRGPHILLPLPVPSSGAARPFYLSLNANRAAREVKVES